MILPLAPKQNSVFYILRWFANCFLWFANCFF